MSGWIKIYRKIADNNLWTSEPFSRGQAWIDLLLLANHEYGYFYLRDHKVEVERGQVGWSQLKLALRWKWSRKKVKRFLNDLEKEQQVVQQLSHSTSVITIINYEEYQEKEQQEEQQKSNRRATEEQQKNTNKKNKEESKKNKEIKNVDIDLIYECYPARCVVGNRSTGKSAKDKTKIKTLLQFHSKEELIKTIRWYVNDCKITQTFMKNFSTFLNNLPVMETKPEPKKRTLPPRPDEKSLSQGQVVDFEEDGQTYRMKCLPDSGRVVVTKLSLR